MSLYFEIKHGNQTFYAILNQSNDDNWELFIGGKKHGCIMMDCKKGRCMLQRVGYDQRCNTSGDMPRGTGTVSMIKAAILFVFDRFPEIHIILLQDHSNVDCNGTEIYLPHTQIIQYGKTWYERKINARLRNEKKYKYIESFITHISQKPKWEVLWNFIKAEIHKEHETSFHKAIHEIWTNTDNFQEMIVYMLKNKQCHLFAEWLDQYFIIYGKISIMNQYYVINRQSDTTFTYASIPSNPYVQQLDKKSHSARFNVFSTYVPRTKYGGTRYTHGLISCNDLSYLD